MHKLRLENMTLGLPLVIARCNTSKDKDKRYKMRLEDMTLGLHLVTARCVSRSEQDA